MKYKTFEEVPVWEDGILLSVRIFALTGDKAFRFKGDIANQLQRAGLSVPNNVAEGFERGTTAELLGFLYYAKGSAGEVKSILHVVARMREFDHLAAEVEALMMLAASIGRQLGAWADSLQNNEEIRGRKFVTDKARNAREEEERRRAFLGRLAEMNEQARQAREAERRQKAGGGQENSG